MNKKVYLCLSCGLPKRSGKGKMCRSLLKRLYQYDYTEDQKIIIDFDKIIEPDRGA